MAAKKEIASLRMLVEDGYKLAYRLKVYGFLDISEGVIRLMREAEIRVEELAKEVEG